VRVEPQEREEVPLERGVQEGPTALPPARAGLEALDQMKVAEVPVRAAAQWAPLAVIAAVPALALREEPRQREQSVPSELPLQGGQPQCLFGDSYHSWN